MTAAALALSAVLGWWAVVPGAGPGTDVVSAAAPNYRFWTYWHRSGGSWTYADTGPSGYRPADGSVDGWRYEVTADGSARAPRTTATFAQICGSTPAVAGRARVAIVFDYGTPADARGGQHPPANRGACAVIVPGGTAITALEAVATLRFRADGIICAFDDYPSSGCVDLVGQPAVPTVSASPSVHRTTRPTTKPTVRVTATPTRTPTRTPKPSSTAPPPRTRPVATTPPSTAPDPTAPDPTAPSPSASRRPSAPATRTSARPPSRRASPRDPATRRATISSSAPAPTSTTGSPSSSTSGAPGAAAAGAASAAGLILTGATRPTTGGVGPATWVGLAVLVLLAATAGVLALRRRQQSRHL